MSRRQLGVLALALWIVGLCGCSREQPYGLSAATAYRKGNDSYCALHDVSLNVGRVPIEYGLYHPSKAYSDLEITTFPNANMSIEGGCTVESSSPTHCQTWYCPECRRALCEWEKNTPEWQRKRIEQVRRQKEKELSDDPPVLAESALESTDDEDIEIRLEYLRYILSDDEKPQPTELAIEAYIRVIRKLEAGWPGFSGRIVAISNSGRERQHRTPHDVLLRQYGVLSVSAFLSRSPGAREAYLRIGPDSRYSELRERWLRMGTCRPGRPGDPLLQRDANVASKAGSCAHGSYVQQWGWRWGVPARQIKLTRADGAKLIWTTYLVDEERAPVTELLDLYVKARREESAAGDGLAYWALD